MRPTVIPAIHREGWPFIAIFAVATIILATLHGVLGFIGIILTAWCVYFFRDPVRVTPMRAGLVVSPADGVVVSLGPIVPPAELGLGDQPLPCVAVFMNVFDVHVNRAPVTGRIRHMAYRPGRFFNASLDKASEHNERNGLVFDLPDGRAIGVVQIAGLVARRIVWWVGTGDAMTAGSRFGMIRFGSRVDVYLPQGVVPQVCLGQRAVAGETVLADLQSSEAQRPGFASEMLRRRPSRQPRRLRAQSINRLIPNMVTLLALCSGLTAVRFALEGRWQATVVAIILAAIFDGLDGRLARLMNATSKFGAELDSLSDFVCFGVVPPIVLFLWGLNDGGRVGWGVALFFTVCMALRLARFNTALEDTARPPWTYNFFTGVPAPAGAALALLPLIAYFEFGFETLRAPMLLGGWLLIVGGLMVSRIPTFSFKKVRIPNWLVLPFMLAAGGIFAGLATEPWMTLMVLQGLYLISIPLSIRAAWRLQRALNRSQTPVSE